MRRTLTVVATLLASALPAAGQVAWDVPALVSPVAPAGVSLFLLGPSGGDIGALATFRHEAGPVGMGYRLAIADEGGNGGVALAGGIDFSGFLSRGVEGSEVDVMWWSGAGLGIGDETVVSFPLGVLAGWSGGDGSTTLTPYGGGHLSLDISSVDANSLDLTGSVDLGLDIVLSSGWLVRFGASFGDRDALAVGFLLPT